MNEQAPVVCSVASARCWAWWRRPWTPRRMSPPFKTGVLTSWRCETTVFSAANLCSVVYVVWWRVVLVSCYMLYVMHAELTLAASCCQHTHTPACMPLLLSEPHDTFTWMVPVHHMSLPGSAGQLCDSGQRGQTKLQTRLQQIQRHFDGALQFLIPA